MAMSENTKKVLEYLKANAGADMTAADVAAALGLAKRGVDGSFTGLQRTGKGFREEAEITLDDGTHAKVKYLRLTDEGMNFDPDATDAE